MISGLTLMLRCMYACRERHGRRIPRALRGGWGTVSKVITGRPEVIVKAVDRRNVIKKGLQIGGAAYAAPTILGLAQHVGAQSVTPGINPACAGKTCTTFASCNGNANCICASTADGRGFCVPPGTPCGAPCGAGNSCPAGSICLINTCCGGPVCISTAAACPPAGVTGAAVPQVSGPTIGGR